MRRLAQGHYQVAISTALSLEYDDVLNRPGMIPAYTPLEECLLDAGETASEVELLRALTSEFGVVGAINSAPSLSRWKKTSFLNR